MAKKKIKKKSIGQILGMALRKKLPPQYHSTAGKEFLKYGDKGFEELSKSRQSSENWKRKIAFIKKIVPHDSNETKAQKERRGYIFSSSGSSSTKLTYNKWRKKHGYGATAHTMNMYNRITK